MLRYGGWTNLEGPEWRERACGCMGPQERGLCTSFQLFSQHRGGQVMLLMPVKSWKNEGSETCLCGTKAAGSEATVAVGSACSGATTLGPGAHSSFSEAPHTGCFTSKMSWENKENFLPHCNRSDQKPAVGHVWNPQWDFQHIRQTCSSVTFTGTHVHDSALLRSPDTGVCSRHLP